MGQTLSRIALAGIAISATSTAGAAPSLPLGKDWALTVHGDFRPRLEAWRAPEGSRSSPDLDAAVTQRARLGADVSHREGLRFELTLQDVRTWGSARQGEFSGLEAYTANASVPLTEQLHLTVGRQELEVGHDRIVGSEDFWQQGRAFDGLKLTLSAAPQHLTVFYAKTREGSVGTYPDRWQSGMGDHDIGGLVSRTALIARHVGSLLFFVDRDFGSGTTRHTFGGELSGHRGPLRYSVETYLQSGFESHELVTAYLGAVRAELASQRRFAPRIAAWFEHASGDGTRQGSFDAPHGSHHEYFGALDLFVQLPESTRFGGLTDLGAGAGARPLPTVKVNLDWHYLSTSEGEPGANVGGVLGHELDLEAGVEIGSVVELEALAGLLLPTSKYRQLAINDPARASDFEWGGFLSLRAQF